LKKWSGLFEIQLGKAGWMKQQPRVNFSKKRNIIFCFKNIRAAEEEKKRWPYFWTTYWWSAGVTLFWDNSPILESLAEISFNVCASKRYGH
jgi:hypothetical protein